MENTCLFKTATTSQSTIADFISKIKDGSTGNVGDSVRIPFKDGRRVEFVITDVDASGVRFESRDCLNEYTPMTQIADYLTRVWNQLPEELQDAIVFTERKHHDVVGRVEVSNERLFLPAASEIFAPDDCYGDRGLYEQLDWYKDVHNQVRALGEGDDADWYWTSSWREGYTAYWCCVDGNGYASYTLASYASVAAPVCFRISKS